MRIDVSTGAREDVTVVITDSGGASLSGVSSVEVGLRGEDSGTVTWYPTVAVVTGSSLQATMLVTDAVPVGTYAVLCRFHAGVETFVRPCGYLEVA